MAAWSGRARHGGGTRGGSPRGRPPGRGPGPCSASTAQLIVLAEACLFAGRLEEATEGAAGLALVERTSARPNEADLLWLRES